MSLNSKKKKRCETFQRLCLRHQVELNLWEWLDKRKLTCHLLFSTTISDLFLRITIKCRQQHYELPGTTNKNRLLLMLSFICDPVQCIISSSTRLCNENSFTLSPPRSLLATKRKKHFTES